MTIKVAQACTILCAWTIQSMEFSRSEYWSGLPLPSPGDLPNPGIKTRSPALQSHQESPTILEWAACPFFRGTSWPGIKPGSPAFHADFLPDEWPGKHPAPHQKKTRLNYIITRRWWRHTRKILQVYSWGLWRQWKKKENVKLKISRWIGNNIDHSKNDW